MSSSNGDRMRNATIKVSFFAANEDSTVEIRISATNESEAGLCIAEAAERLEALAVVYPRLDVPDQMADLLEPTS